MKTKVVLNTRSNFNVRSSHGILYVNKHSGVVEAAMVFDSDSLDEEDKRSQKHIQDIAIFDISEWKSFYGKDLDDSIDILDLGYWYRDNGFFAYSEPVNDWREEFRKDVPELAKADFLKTLPSFIDLVEQQWTDFELHGVLIDFDIKGTMVHSINDDREEVTKSDYFCVYVHLLEGGIQEIANFKTIDEAEKFLITMNHLIPYHYNETDSVI